jgi:branched-chain amino acid transport system ATP-binding protein
VSSHTTADRRTVLQVEDVVMRFGGLQALGGVSLQVADGEHLAILGPNGAGKTTLFNVIAGDLVPTGGRVVVDGTDVTAMPQRTRPGLGVARTYQRTRLFGGLSVEDNLYLAIVGKHGPRMRMLPDPARERRRQRAREVAETVWLQRVVDQRVEDLSHGQKRQLEVGMALAADPTIVMLDEPASGLSRGERERLTELLAGMSHDVTLLLIEHDMDVALQVADRVHVMADGRTVAEGTPEEIRQDDVVRDIYLGTH